MFRRETNADLLERACIVREAKKVVRVPSAVLRARGCHRTRDVSGRGISGLFILMGRPLYCLGFN